MIRYDGGEFYKKYLLKVDFEGKGFHYVRTVVFNPFLSRGTSAFLFIAIQGAQEKMGGTRVENHCVRTLRSVNSGQLFDILIIKIYSYFPFLLL